MKRLTALVVLLALLFSCFALCLTSCRISDALGLLGETAGGKNNGETQNGKTDTDKNGDSANSGNATVIVPVYKDYDRGAVSFSDMVYKRPDIDAVCEKFRALTAEVKENTLPFGEIVGHISALDPEYLNLRTMYSLADIHLYADSSSAYWAEESRYISEKYPDFTKAVEDLLVAAANSPEAARYEAECFGNGLIDEYKNGGRYSDAVVDLLAKEAALENSFLSVSTATVEVTYAKDTGTVDRLLEKYAGLYGEKSEIYATIRSRLMSLYEEKVNELNANLLVELIRARRKIADALSLDSYADYAYDTLYHDYTPAEAKALTNDIVTYILPVYRDLCYTLAYADTTKKLDTVPLINTLYELYKNTDDDFADAFSYLLQYGLYDIAPAAGNRADGAFTTYLDLYDSPFIFMTTGGTIEDFLTLSHEFGHFCDAFVNYDSSTSLDLSETYSQGTELLTLLKLKTVLSKEDYNALYIAEMSRILFDVFIVQGFYARFEELAYALPYDEITRENLDRCVLNAALDFGLNPLYCNSLEVVTISHIMLYPFYVQSYCTSAAVALQLFFSESAEKGAGLASLKALMDRGDREETFVGFVTGAGLDSPFRKHLLKDLANEIYYGIVGKYYYRQNYTPNAT